MTSSAHSTSYRETVDWRDRAACRDRPEHFDLDVIRYDLEAVHQALADCRACPVLAQCRTFTRSLGPMDKPKELVQAGRVWATNKNWQSRLNQTCLHGVPKKKFCPRCERSKERDRAAAKALRARRKAEKAIAEEAAKQAARRAELDDAACWRGPRNNIKEAS